MKYPINKEFFPYSRMTPPIQNAKMAGWMGSMMKPPRWVRKNSDHEVSIKKETIKSYDGVEIEILIFDLTELKNPRPALFIITAEDSSSVVRAITINLQGNMRMK